MIFFYLKFYRPFFFVMLAYLMICVVKSVKENKLSKGMRVVSDDSPILKSIFCAQLLKGERILRRMTTFLQLFYYLLSNIGGLAFIQATWSMRWRSYHDIQYYHCDKWPQIFCIRRTINMCQDLFMISLL